MDGGEEGTAAAAAGEAGGGRHRAALSVSVSGPATPRGPRSAPGSPREAAGGSLQAAHSASKPSRRKRSANFTAAEKAEAVQASAALLARKMLDDSRQRLDAAAGGLPQPPPAGGSRSPAKRRTLSRSQSHSSVHSSDGGAAATAAAAGTLTPRGARKGRRRGGRRRRKRSNSHHDGDGGEAAPAAGSARGGPQPLSRSSSLGSLSSGMVSDTISVSPGTSAAPSPHARRSPESERAGKGRAVPPSQAEAAASASASSTSSPPPPPAQGADGRKKARSPPALRTDLERRPAAVDSPASPLFSAAAGHMSPAAAGAAAAAALLGSPGGGRGGADGVASSGATPAASPAGDGAAAAASSAASASAGAGASAVSPPSGASPALRPRGGSGSDTDWKLRWFDEFSGGRMRHSTMPLLQQSHETRRKLEQGILKFNEKPSAGVRYVVDAGLVEDSPDGVADFLLTSEGLSKEQIGQYLGGSRPYQISVLFAYVNRLDLRGRQFVDALRYFLSGFRLPGEAQQIDRMMEKFAERYCRDNPDVFATQDGAYLLAYSLIMLNTDAHSDRVKHKMTKSQFVRSSRGLTTEGIPEPFLEQCYRAIKEQEIRVNYDYMEQLYARIRASELSSVRYTMRRRRSLSAINLSEQACFSMQAAVRQQRSHARRHSAGAALSASQSLSSLAEEGNGGSGLLGPSSPDGQLFDFSRLAHLGKLSSGNVFMKHGRRGAPHPRKVWVSDDMSEIWWQDPEQTARAKRICTADVLDVRVGRDTTQVFQRAAHEIHETKDALCFSVVTAERTLDLEADRPEEVSAWVDFLTQVVEENVIRSEAASIEARRARRERDIVASVDEWRKFMFARWADFQAGVGGKVAQRFRRVWGRGIPPSVRCRAWPRAIGNVLEVTPELFEAFLNMARLNQRQLAAESPHAFLGVRASVQQLLRDLPRTFPELGFFHSGGPHLMQDQLREVLQAYMFFRPDIGYMHGMSHIAAMLLLYTNFYDAFLCLCNLLHSHYFLSFCRMDMRQLRWRFAFFDAAFERHLPGLHLHFSHLRLSPEMYLVDWCLALFAKTLPLDVASRLWDAYLLDGEVVVYRAGLAILAYHERQLLRSAVDDCLLLLRDAQQYRDVPIDEERFWELTNDAAAALDAAAFDELLAEHTEHTSQLRKPLRGLPAPSRRQRKKRAARRRRQASERAAGGAAGAGTTGTRAE